MLSALDTVGPTLCAKSQFRLYRRANSSFKVVIASNLIDDILDGGTSKIKGAQ
jgi:hypothetical protein